MPVVEVSCPNCGVKLKAPDNMAGKKAKCKKCGTAFRIPGPVPASESASEGQALSVLSMPLPPLPDDDLTEVMMAEPIASPPAPPRPAPAPPVAPTAKNVAALPSADPFDFGKPAAPSPAAPAPAAPAKAGFGAAKAPAAPTAPSAPKLPPVAPKPAAATPAAPAPAKKPAPPAEADAPKAKKAAPVEDDAPPPKAKKAAKEPEPEPEPALTSESDDAPPINDAFSFSALMDGPAEQPRSKRRDEDDEDDDRPRKKRRDDDDEDDAPRTKKKKRDDDEDDEPRAKKKKRDDDDEDDRRDKKKKRGSDEPEDGEKPRYRRQQGGMGKSIVITAGVGLVALALGITAVIVYAKNKKKDEPEVAKKDEKKDDTTPIPGGIPPDPVNPNAPKPKDKVDPGKPKEKEKDPEPPPGGRPYAKLPALKSFTVGMPPAKGAVSDAAKNAGKQPVLDVPVASVRRVFPPLDPTTGDTYVLVQLAPASGGKNEKLALDTYGPAGNRVAAARIEYEGDGAANPIADLYTSTAGVTFLASVEGKTKVWKLGEKTEVMYANVSPYAAKPEHAKSGVAAAFFAPEPNHVVYVSTAGQVLLYDLATNKPVDKSDFTPPNGAAGKVALGSSVAKAEGNGSVVVAVAGVVYQVKAQAGLEVLVTHDLGGDVGRSLALSVSGTPGRLLYAFESARKEVAVMGLTLGERANRVMYKWPTEALGEPKAALWTQEELGGIVCDKGVVWFDDHEGKFVPLVVTQPTAAGAFFADDKHFWYAVPHAMPTKSVLVAITGEFNARADYLKSFPNALKAVRIDAAGLSK